MRQKRPEIKVMCLFQKDGRLLVTRGFDNVKNEEYFRIVGGTVEFGETARETLKREMNEELDSEVKNLKLLTITENIFHYQGEEGHEICFIFKGDLSNERIYQTEKIPILDEEDSFAEWVSVSDALQNKIRLYPPINLKEFLSS